MAPSMTDLRTARHHGPAAKALPANGKNLAAAKAPGRPKAKSTASVVKPPATNVTLATAEELLAFKVSNLADNVVEELCVEFSLADGMALEKFILEQSIKALTAPSKPAAKARKVVKTTSTCKPVKSAAEVEVVAVDAKAAPVQKPPVKLAAAQALAERLAAKDKTKKAGQKAVAAKANKPEAKSVDVPVVELKADEVEGRRLKFVGKYGEAAIAQLPEELRNLLIDPVTERTEQVELAAVVEAFASASPLLREAKKVEAPTAPTGDHRPFGRRPASTEPKVERNGWGRPLDTSRTQLDPHPNARIGDANRQTGPAADGRAIHQLKKKEGSRKSPSDKKK